MNSKTQRPRVALDLLPLQTGSAYQGIGRYVRELGRALLEVGTVKDLELWGLHLQDSRVKADPLQQALNEAKRLPSKPNWRQLTKLMAAAQQAGCAMLHILEPWPLPPPPGLPIVATCHDVVRLQLPHLYSRRIPQLRKGLAWVSLWLYLRRASAVIADSYATAKQVTTRLWFPRPRIHVAYPGIDPVRFHPHAAAEEAEALSHTLGLQPGYVLFVGTGDPRKSLPQLIASLAEAKLGRPLVLVGKIHPQQEAAVAHTLARVPPETTRILGFVPDELLPVLYRHCSAFVFPSLAEGFGLPVVEAMACGAPVVAFADEAVAEVSGAAALLVPVGDFFQLACALRDVVTNLNLQRRLREAGLIRAQAFRWEATAERVFQVYTQVLQKNR